MEHRTPLPTPRPHGIMNGGERAWSGRSRGGGIGTRLMRLVAQTCGPTPAYLFVTLPVVWFVATDHSSRRNADRYWRQVRPGLGRWGRLLMVIAQFHDFARALTDRVLLPRAPGCVTWRNFGIGNIQKAIDDGRGVVLASAHHGNWELAGQMLDPDLERPGVLNLVMLDSEDPRVKAELDRAMGDRPYHIIGLNDSVGAGLAISAALGRGETCAMLADRTVGTGGTVRVPFLGADAAFPVGPVLSAALAGAAFIPTFCIRCGWTRYRVFAVQPWYPRITSRTARKRQLAAWVAAWVRLLERQVRRNPLQWHNFFYDFWSR